jgi:ferredoxin-like protein FixX
MREDAIFIGIEVDDDIVDDDAIASKLAEVCPVDIYANNGGRVDIVEENIDECVLCRLCLDAAGDKVAVYKLYDGDAKL